MRLSCSELSADDSAEVEARARTTLLLKGDASARAQIDCDERSATVITLLGEQRESLTIALPTADLKEQLLAALERLLQAEHRPNESASAAPNDTGSPSPATPAATASSAPVAVSVADSAPARLASKPESRLPSPVWRVAGSAGAELWSPHLAYGARVLAEVSAVPWTTGLALGGLTPFDPADAFVATEWHAFLFGAFESSALFGLRGAFGLGWSVLTVRPGSDVRARSATSLPSAVGVLSVMRPVRWRRFSLLPELELRLFVRRREVRLDHEQQLEVPVATPAALLGVAYEL